jgi:hypothetical protein
MGSFAAVVMAKASSKAAGSSVVSLGDVAQGDEGAVPLAVCVRAPEFGGVCVGAPAVEEDGGILEAGDSACRGLEDAVAVEQSVRVGDLVEGVEDGPDGTEADDWVVGRELEVVG